jgi:hypothetical protein
VLGVCTCAKTAVMTSWSGGRRASIAGSLACQCLRVSVCQEDEVPRKQVRLWSGGHGGREWHTMSERQPHAHDPQMAGPPVGGIWRQPHRRGGPGVRWKGGRTPLAPVRLLRRVSLCQSSKLCASCWVVAPWKVHKHVLAIHISIQAFTKHTLVPRASRAWDPRYLSLDGKCILLATPTAPTLLSPLARSGLSTATPRETLACLRGTPGPICDTWGTTAEADAPRRP